MKPIEYFYIASAIWALSMVIVALKPDIVSSIMSVDIGIAWLFVGLTAFFSR